MTPVIRIPFSVDHHKKKTVSISLSFPLYLHLVSADMFVEILAPELARPYKKARTQFFDSNKFLSAEYEENYRKTAFVRMACGPDIHRFLARILSVNYQSFRTILNEKAGSFSEFFGVQDLIWSDAFKGRPSEDRDRQSRDAIFCWACVEAQYRRQEDKKELPEKLDVFAKRELAEKNEKIGELTKERDAALDQVEVLEAQLSEVQAQLDEKTEPQVVLVPSDPCFMLGLMPSEIDKADQRAKSLMKVLHPDKSGTSETAYLFDMVLRARDQLNGKG